MKKINAGISGSETSLRRILLHATLAGCLALFAPTLLLATAEAPQPARPGKEKIIAMIADETALSAEHVRHALADATFIPSIIERINTPYESRPYAQYKPLFVYGRMKKMGLAFLSEHAPIFAAVEKEYRVEAKIIAAILGLETRFGRNRGKDRVLDSLYTLATGYPRRADFFRKQLGEFLLLSSEEKLDPAMIRGSYAGAFGTTQFIPSSFRAFAVDADHDGKRDVFDSAQDIIASVANYFHRHGWQHGRPMAYWLPASGFAIKPALRRQADSGLKSWVKLSDLRRLLPKLPAIWRDDDKVSIIEMETKHGKQLALIHYNFYVITRWNRSYNYAMAVTEVAAMLGCDVCSVS
jgi:membrane-bound lytic murein transglycosylase B